MLPADLQNEPAIGQAIEETGKLPGPIDTLVNRRGTIYVSPIHEIDVQACDVSTDDNAAHFSDNAKYSVSITVK